MVMELAKQAETAVNKLLVAVNADAVATVELRQVLTSARSIAAVVTATQTAAAELIASRERHGDGGAEILAASAGLPQREAHSQVKTAQALRKVPKLRDAVQSGEVPQANARKLADAITKTGSAAVASDAELLKQAGSMRPEQFSPVAQRWINRKRGDHGASEHARQRARRNLRIFDLEDGMVCVRGEFDKITEQRIGNRLRRTAEMMFKADKKLPADQRREFVQCMADALQHHTTSTAATGTFGSEGTYDDAREQHRSTSSGSATGTAPRSGAVSATDTTSQSSGGGGWLADITVLAQVDESTGDLIYELSDGSHLPPAIVEEMTCNARLTGLVYSRAGDALWRTRSRRTVTESQWQALLTTYGGCFHCGAPPNICQAHHITPYSQGGATSLDNLIMVCWSCHHKIHHHNWQINEHADGSHTLRPPERISASSASRYGPAHADDQPPPTHHSSLRNRKARTRTRSKTLNNRANPQARDPAPATLW